MMGMFDYVRIPIKCKKCGKVHLDAQTKDTECCLTTFTLENGFLHATEMFTGGMASILTEQDEISHVLSSEKSDYPKAKHHYYSGHMDAYIKCCDEWTTNRFIFVRGQLVYQDVL